MARLNEPPIAPAPHLSTSSSPTESLEAQVKRRFIRQNRELAKNNSAQSLKIRSLESEVSKLLAHNLELRERNLALEYRLEKQVQNGSGGNGFKRALRRKLEELSGLVDGIEDDEEDETFVREEVDRERILSPTHQQYRERQPLGELMRDSQMPTINEGKSFPRLTMNDEEIRATMRVSDGSAATGSPDLGPPPVARFDCEENQENGGNGEEELMPSVNLETRRRRKEPSEREIRRSSILALSPAKLDVEPAATSMLKTGAKRKLADRDAEKTAKKDDFSFTRKPSAEDRRENENEAQASPPAKSTAPIKAPASPARPARKVLGDKSVNMSPRKTAPTKPGKEDPIKPAKEDPIKPAKPASRSQSTSRPPSRGRRTSSAPNLLSQTQHQEPAIASIELPPPEPSTSAATHPPKTPAPPLEDLFSPEPSASASQPAAVSRDTPPPSDLSSLSNTTTDARPSRRARSSVNYAEPSLVAKMRRPGKGMVDAISGLPQSRRSISADVPVTMKKEVEVKTEPVDDEDIWAAKGSPLRGKERGAEPESEESSIDKIAVAQSRRQSAVVAESRKKREAIRSSSSSCASSLPVVESIEVEAVAVADKLAEMDLYDFKDESSSPVSAKGEVGARQKTSANGRRHSSVLKPAGGEVLKVREKVDAPGKGSRRRSMMI